MQGRQLATGTVEIVYHDGAYVTDAARHNIIIVIARGALWTPPVEGALRGVARHYVNATTRGARLRILERSIPIAAPGEAFKIFLTGSKRGWPAVGQVVGTDS